MGSSAISLPPNSVGRSDEEIQGRLAWELLRLELDHWRETGSLIQPHILAFIHRRRDTLPRLTKDEAELLFRSALAAGWGIAEWVERAWTAGAPVDGISLEELRRDNFRIRAAAVAALGALEKLQGQEGQFISSIIQMLVDDYPQVRGAAIRTLERLQPGGEWRKDLVYERYVPAGEFVMGDDGPDLFGKKASVHQVWVDAFYIGKYPVTNGDYRRYVDDVGCEFELPEGKRDYPVVDVSWFHARDYAAWAGMRLLTEAEWEKAASWLPVTGREEVAEEVTETRQRQAKRHWWHFMERFTKRGSSGQERDRQAENVIASRKRMYPWGNAFDPSRCNTGESRREHTTPVGFFSPQGDSPYGCVDMVGNVWEWTSTLYRAYPYRADDGREDMALSGYRVIRGGAFLSYQDLARCGDRFGLPPYFSNLYRGFRVGMSTTA